jgi:hypothetical protein
MALIAHGGPRRITMLLAYLTRPRIKPIAAQSIAIEVALPSSQHHYAPKRDRFIESAAMGREMYRL